MRVRKLFFTFTFLLIVSGIVFGGITGKITGRVTDKDTGEPLASANVLIKGTSLGSTTDLDGNYFILNVPVGSHEVVVSTIGYQTVEFSKVVVYSNLTTNVDAVISQSTLDLEPVYIIAERPMIQKDVTASRNIKTSQDIMAMPVDNIFEVVNLTAGTVGNNFRGGRDTEVVYLVDGASIMDPVAGQYRGSVPTDAIEELSTETGGFSAEYGNAQSGIVSMVMKEGGDKYSGSLRYKTNNFNNPDISLVEHLNNYQASLGGPIPFTKEYLPGTGIKFFAAAELYDTDGRFAHEDSTSLSYSGKISYNITDKHKIAISGFWNDQEYNNYQHLWSNTTYEDLWYTGDSYFDSTAGWVGNGIVNNEDTNHNGILDPGEDLNGDGAIQNEDLNHDNLLSSFNMLDNTRDYERTTNKITAKWTYNHSARTFYEFQVDRYYTKYHANTNERINEDANGSGELDMENWIPYAYINSVNFDGHNYYFDNAQDPTAFWIDFNSNGMQDMEDLNFNGVWDWNAYGRDTDLFYDKDDDGFMDASCEDRDGLDLDGDGNSLDPWEDLNGNGINDSDIVEWENLPPIPSNARDAGDFYQYANGTTYPRARWYNYDRTRWHYKGTVFSQVNKFHQIKAGGELDFMNIFDHEVDFASGGNVYGQNYTVEPKSQALFVEDKMEFEGLIVKIGLRYDRFDANYKNYPSDVNNPVTDPSMGGTILNPTSVAAKNYVSPRFSVAFPFTAVDKMRFTYDKYFQMPILRYAFRNLNYDLSGAFPIIGNANLEPERTTLYELGWEHLLTDDIAFETVGFYKDITGLTDIRQTYYTVTDWYGLYYNTDYGNVRGFELNLTKRGNWTSGSINYTYSVAKGKSSTSRQDYETVWANNIIPTTEQYLDWDQRHTVNGNIQLRIPRDVKNRNLRYFEDSGISVIGQYGSGLPFTFAPNAGRLVVNNNERLPWTLRFDVRMDKRFLLTKTTFLVLYVQINNIFDRQNVDAEYFQAGGSMGDTIDPSYYMQGDADFDGKPDYDMDGKYNDPEVWEMGRVIRAGLTFEF